MRILELCVVEEKQLLLVQFRNMILYMHQHFLLSLVLTLACFSTVAAEVFSEKSFINLGGEEQYVEIIATDKTNPVLIFIHGGPGWPQTPSIRAFNSEIARHFTMVIWEQRGAGQSFMRNPNPTGMNFEQFVADANQLTDLMRKRFSKRKIYLVGYSWGSAIGLTLAERQPEKFQAYIGIGQMVNMALGMEYSQEWIRKKAKKAEDAPTLERLAKLKNPPKEFCSTQFECFMEQYVALSKYNGHIYDPKINEKIIAKTARYKDYEKYDWIKPFNFSWRKLQFDLETFDARKIKKLEIPIYLFLGRHDHNVPSVLAADYVRGIDAPKKVVVWIENAGHPVMEEGGDVFNDRFVQEILNES